MTRSTETRYQAPVPTVVLRPVLWEVADIVEQIFRVAYTENLHPRLEEYDMRPATIRPTTGSRRPGCARRCASTAP